MFAALKKVPVGLAAKHLPAAAAAAVQQSPAPLPSDTASSAPWSNPPAPTAPTPAPPTTSAVDPAALAATDGRSKGSRQPHIAPAPSPRPSTSLLVDDSLAQTTDSPVPAPADDVPYPPRLSQHVVSFLLSYPTVKKLKSVRSNADFYLARDPTSAWSGGGAEPGSEVPRRSNRERGAKQSSNPPGVDSPSGNGVSWCLEQLYNDPGSMFNEIQLWPWLFPLPTPGPDAYSSPLQAHEVEMILNSPSAIKRLERAHVLTLRMLGIRMADLGTGLLTPAFDAGELFPLFTDPQTSKCTSDILTRMLQSLTILSPEPASRSSFLRHVPSTIGFLIAAHNEGLLDLARGSEAGRGLEREWGLAVVNRETRDELMALAHRRVDHSAPPLPGPGSPGGWGWHEYEQWVIRQNLRYGTLKQRFAPVFALPTTGPNGEPLELKVETDAEREERCIGLALAEIKRKVVDIEFKDKVRKGVIKMERPAPAPAVEEVADKEDAVA